LGGLTIYSSMKLINFFKDLIIEAKVLLRKYRVDGNYVDLLYNDHSNLSVNSSKYGRQSVEEIKNSISEIIDVIVSICLEILAKPSRVVGNDHSILVKDYMIGMDYHFWVTLSPDGNIVLTINTSIGHPKKLPDNQNDKKIILSKYGETIIKEDIDLNVFTKIVKGNIIIYHN